MPDRRRIVLTGCTRGLGRVLLDRFVEAGHQVLGCGRSVAAVNALRASLGSGHDFDVVDVADLQAVVRWADRLTTQFGPPDLLINNAALINTTKPLWEIDPDEFHRLVDVNLTGTFHVLRSFLPSMVARKAGIIVNFSSGWGRSVDAQVAPYCATKWGVEGLTLALAEELPDGMAAVSLNPGVIDTDMLRSCWGDFAQTCHKPAEWSQVAAKLILNIGPDDNGQQLAVSLTQGERSE